MTELWRASIEHGEIQFGPANAEAKEAIQRGEIPWDHELAVSAKAPAIPVCPECGALLTARATERRFPENNRFQECANGHVWYLEASRTEVRIVRDGDDVAIDAVTDVAPVGLQGLATALRDVSGAAAIFEQNSTDDNRRMLNAANHQAEELLERFVRQEGDIRPNKLSAGLGVQGVDGADTSGDDPTVSFSAGEKDFHIHRRFRDSDARAVMDLRAAISRHRNQIEGRGQGRRISGTAANRELWAILDPEATE